MNSFQKQIGKTRIGCEIVNNKYPVMVMMMMMMMMAMVRVIVIL